jgi:hypothetical protein
LFELIEKADKGYGANGKLTYYSIRPKFLVSEKAGALMTYSGWCKKAVPGKE